jgi:hypothetical protein
LENVWPNFAEEIEKVAIEFFLDFSFTRVHSRKDGLIE